MTTIATETTPARAPGTVPALVGRTFDDWLDDNRTPFWVVRVADHNTVRAAMRLAYEAGATGNPVTANAEADRT